MLNLNIFLSVVYLVIHSHVQKTLCFYAFINSRNYTAVKLLPGAKLEGGKGGVASPQNTNHPDWQGNLNDRM
jgi:hypothetical protein